MPVKIVDAPAIGALLFGEPLAEAIVVRLGRATLAAPALLPFEVANLALKKIRRHPDTRASLVTALDMLAHLSVETVAVDHDDVLRLAEVAGLTACDASDLWLAQELNAEMFTLNQRLEAVSVLT